MDESELGTTVCLVPNGDIRISVRCSAEQKKRPPESDELKTSQKTLIVSSVVMCIASPVWKAMFDGRFLEAIHSSSTRDVHFEEDDPAALLLILRIAHMQFKKIPETLSYEELLNVAIICDKYDTVDLVQPWIQKWESKAKHAAYKPGNENYLFIAWPFGDLPTYEKLAANLVSTSLIDDSQRLLSKEGTLIEGAMPPNAIESIAKARELAIRELLKACYQLVQRYESEQIVCQATFAGGSRLIFYSKAVRTDCDALVLGSLIKGLRRIEIWPGPLNHYEVRRSLADLLTGVRSLHCFALSESEHSENEDHVDCKFTKVLGPQMDHIQRSFMSSGVDESHKKHMKEQASKRGNYPKVSE